MAFFEAMTPPSAAPSPPRPSSTRIAPSEPGAVWWARLERLLADRRGPVYLALLACLLCSGALGNGFFLDDYIHRAVLEQPAELPEVGGSAAQLFRFVAGPEARDRFELDGRGVDSMSSFLPWWASDDLRLAMWRPSTGYSHWLDHRLWPDSAFAAHLHSLAWLALAIWAGAVLYRRLFGPSRAAVAGLAALLFAVDELHAWPAMWIANRNASISGSLGLLCLVVHDRWRRQGWRPGAWLGPVLLLLAVHGGEAAVACGGFLVAYALFLDSGAWRERLLSLVPSAAVGVVWLLAYRLAGYGAHGSSGYLDPIGEPVRFALGLVERVPIMLLGILSPMPADLYLVGGPDARRFLWWAMVLLLAAGAVALRSLARDPVARFLIFALATSLVPAGIVFPMNRQLFFPGFAGLGLVALAIARLWPIPSQKTPVPTRGRAIARGMAGLLLVVHLVIAPIALAGSAPTFALLADVVARAVHSLAEEVDAPARRTVVVHAPGHAFTSGARIMLTLERKPAPADLLVLASSIGWVEVERSGDRTLRVRPEAGFLHAPETAPGLPGRPFDPMRVFSVFDSLFFDADALPAVGQRFDLPARGPLPAVEIEVTRTTPDGRPAEVLYRFAGSFDGPGSTTPRFVHWRDGRFVRFELPALGETVRLPRPGLGLGANRHP